MIKLLFNSEGGKTMLLRSKMVIIGVAACLLAGCSSSGAGRVRLPIPHFLQVDSRLYRGGQPTDEGYRRLADLGVKTVVNLRTDEEVGLEETRHLVESLGMRWVSLPMRAYGRPTDAQIDAFLQAVGDPRQQPVYIHCRQGKDRTGTMVAVYRIVEDGWEPERAYREARALGLTPWNPFMRYVILHRAHGLFVRPASRPTQVAAARTLGGP